MLEGLKGFFDLLGVEPIWGIILLIAILLLVLIPWRLEYKIETEDENGKKTTHKIYRIWDK